MINVVSFRLVTMKHFSVIPIWVKASVTSVGGGEFTIHIVNPFNIPHKEDLIVMINKDELYIDDTDFPYGRVQYWSSKDVFLKMGR